MHVVFLDIDGVLNSEAFMRKLDYQHHQLGQVDRFVILDDCSDMEMHKNRLVQTDWAEGLLDEDVELAIRVMSWDGKTVPSPMDELEE